MNPIGRWMSSRRELRAFPERAAAKDEELTKALLSYRLHLTELSFKARRIDKTIWATYDEITSRTRALEKQVQGSLIKTPRGLRSLHQSWSHVFQMQEELLTLVQKALSGTTFYNKMETAKSVKRELEETEEEKRARISNAKRALIRSIHYVVLREEEGEPVTRGSVLLSTDEAAGVWRARLERIAQAEADGSFKHPDALVAELNQLRQTILEAPGQAEAVKLVEDEVADLLTLEEKLGRYGGSAIAEIELNDAMVILQEDIPRLWATGDWEALDEALGRIRGFVRRNEGHVRSELYVARKRSLEPVPTEIIADQERTEAAVIPGSGGNGSEPGMSEVDLVDAKLQELAMAGQLADENKESEEDDLDAYEDEPAKAILDPDVDPSIRMAFEGSTWSGDQAADG